MILWILFILIVLFCIGIGILFSNKIMYIQKKTDEEILQRESGSNYNEEEFLALPKEEVWIQSPFGYQINGLFIPADNSKYFMIFCHGVTVNKINSIKYSNLFLKKGFNVLLYDHRRHGNTGGHTTSYGYYEKQDLKAVVDWTKKKFGPAITLGIHGESMGAAIMLQYAGIVEDGADFYISDCSFSDFSEQLSYRLRMEFHLPKWPFITLADLFLKLRDGYSLKDISPITNVDQIKHPVLFIHSKKDDYILPSMTEALFNKKKGPKLLFLAENGVHALSYVENKKEYEKIIDSFLYTYVF